MQELVDNLHLLLTTRTTDEQRKGLPWHEVIQRTEWRCFYEVVWWSTAWVIFNLHLRYPFFYWVDTRLVRSNEWDGLSSLTLSCRFRFSHWHFFKGPNRYIQVSIVIHITSLRYSCFRFLLFKLLHWVIYILYIWLSKKEVCDFMFMLQLFG